MTKEVLGKALSDAIAKIDKMWDDVHGNFASHASTNNVYDEVENDYGWNEGFFTGMLWLAYEATGDEKYREFFNPDGMPDRGETAQGASDNSCWARGQSWSVSGLPYSYRYTKEKPMLELFEKVANYYINHLPDDFVPYWDLSFSDGADEPKDSSAAAIAVCGFLEMIPNIKDDSLRAIYEGVVDKMMFSLYNNYSTKDTPDSNGLLLHAVYSKPAGVGVDECNIWGCYYYMEALVRMIKGTKAYW